MKRIVAVGVLTFAFTGMAFGETIDQMMSAEATNSHADWYNYAAQTSHLQGVDRKSAPLALFLSAALPGAGEMYMGASGRSKIFFGVEVATWASYLAFTYQGRRIRDDYKLFAGANAGATTGIDSEEYWNAIEWNSTYEDYLEKIKEEARALYPGDQGRQQAYIAEHSFSSDLVWSWDDADAIEEYRSLRRGSRNAFQYAIYSTGFALLNRLVSLMDVIMLTRQKEKKVPAGRRVQLIIEPERDVAGFRFGVLIKG